MATFPFPVLAGHAGSEVKTALKNLCLLDILQRKKKKACSQPTKLPAKFASVPKGDLSGIDSRV